MNITTGEIVARINSEFASTYKPFSNFPNSGMIWNECIGTIQDARLMNNIIFCNDVLQMPPVKVFLLANKNINVDLTDEEKKSIGAFWGFVFKFVFGYRNQKSISVRVCNVKSATYFFDGPQDGSIEVLKNA